MMRVRPAGSGGLVGPSAIGVCRQMWLAGGCALLLFASPATAASDNVRITNLGDVAFGTVADLATDAIRSQSLCVYANTPTRGYNVRAVGSGPGGAFALSSGAASMPFDVQWSSSPGQGSGVQLSPNVALSGQVSSATQQTCNAGPAASASLVVILRTAALSSAPAGSYGGSLTLVIGAE